MTWVLQDYMERHGIEATHNVAGRDAEHGHHSHHHRRPSTANFLSPEHAASNLSVPDIDAASGNSQEIPSRRSSRGSSLKLSRQRARSFGPGQRKRSVFQRRSGSVDTPVQAESETNLVCGRLQGAKSDTFATGLNPNSPGSSALSVAAASLAMAFGVHTPQVLMLQVPELGARATPPPIQRPAKLTLKECYTVKDKSVVEEPIVPQVAAAAAAAPPPAKNSSSASCSLNPRLAAPDSVVLHAQSAAPRGALTSVEVHMPDQASPCPPVQHSQTNDDTPSAANALLGAGLGPGLGAGLFGAGVSVPSDVERLELPSATADLLHQARTRSGSWSTESLVGDSTTDLHLLPSPDAVPDNSAKPPSLELPHLHPPPHSDLLSTNNKAASNTPPQVRPLDLLDCSQRPVFHQQVPPPHALSLPGRERLTVDSSHKNRPPLKPQRARLDEQGTSTHLTLPPRNTIRPDSEDRVDSTQAQQHQHLGVTKMLKDENFDQSLCAGLEPSLQGLTLQGVAGATGITSNFHPHVDDLEDVEELDSELVDNDFQNEDDDLFSRIVNSDHNAHHHNNRHVRQYLASLPKGRGCSSGGLCRDQVPIQHSLPSPDEQEEDLLLTGIIPSTTASASASATASVATPGELVSVRPRNKRGSTGSHSQASSSGTKSIPGKRNSGTFQKLKTPTTPMSWMALRSPLARIESFHSDDFEYFTSSDNDADRASSASPMSASTPTVPCFGYKLHLAGRKKPPKMKKGSTSDNTGGKTGKKSTDKNKSNSSPS